MFLNNEWHRKVIFGATFVYWETVWYRIKEANKEGQDMA